METNHVMDYTADNHTEQFDPVLFTQLWLSAELKEDFLFMTLVVQPGLAPVIDRPQDEESPQRMLTGCSPAAPSYPCCTHNFIDAHIQNINQPDE
ncbi:hypothetical protein ABVT39_001029 [Epinephelus coioides]